MKNYSNSVGGGENLKINSISWGSFNFSNSIGGGGKKKSRPVGGRGFFLEYPLDLIIDVANTNFLSVSQFYFLPQAQLFNHCSLDSTW